MFIIIDFQETFNNQILTIGFKKNIMNNLVTTQHYYLFVIIK